MSYLRTNFRFRTGWVKLLTHSDSTAGILTNMSPPTGLICVSANCSQILYYYGGGFKALSADASTAA